MLCLNEILTCLLNSSTCGPSVWGSASWTNRMTSSTDQEEASFPEASLSGFRWSEPVVELAAVEGERRQPNQTNAVSKYCSFCVCVCVYFPTLHSSGWTHLAQFGGVGADAAQRRRRRVCVSGVIWPLLLRCSVVGCGVEGAGAGRGILGGVVVRQAVLRLGQRFCFKRG